MCPARSWRIVHGRSGVLLIDPGVLGDELAALANDLRELGQPAQGVAAIDDPRGIASTRRFLARLSFPWKPAMYERRLPRSSGPGRSERCSRPQACSRTLLERSWNGNLFYVWLSGHSGTYNSFPAPSDSGFARNACGESATITPLVRQWIQATSPGEFWNCWPSTR